MFHVEHKGGDILACYIGEASIDERGQISGGQLGDQTGEEVRVTPWYAQTRNGRKWDWVARLKDSVPNSANIKKAIAVLCIESCNNQNVGYDQSRRWTFGDLCRANGWKPKEVNEPCATDCSALVACVLNCLGINVSMGMTTRDELAQLKNTELFEILTSAEYITTGDNLQQGDILHMEGHTAICVQNSSQPQPVADDKKEDEQVGARMWINWSLFESGKEYNNNSGWYINGDKGRAYGRYQFDYRYGLVPFMQFCIQQYPDLFSGFQPYIDLGVGNEQLIANSGLIQLFTDYTNNHLAEFSKMQNWQMYNTYYLLIRDAVLKHAGYDINNIGTYAVGTAASIAIRNSGYWDANVDIFTGTTGKESESDWIKIVMARQNAKTGSYDGNRWTTTQYNRVFSDMQNQVGVVQIGQGTIVDSPTTPSPVNPAGGSAGSAGTPEIKKPTPDTSTNGGIEAGEVYNTNWLLKYFTNILPWNKS